MKCARIAILGAARSGIAVARAALELGANPAVYDKKPEANIGPAAQLLRDQGIPLITNFDRPFRPKEVDILVTSPGVDSRSTILQETAEAGIEVISEVEFGYRISKAPIVAITGTNGKSTTTLMTWLCLNSMFGEGRAKLCGNIYGSGYAETPLVEAAMASASNDVLVAEISSFQLEWVSEFRPRCAAVTNIAPDHLNRYDSFEKYAETKRRIYRRMGDGDTYVHHKDPVTQPPAEAGFRVVETKFDGAEIQLENLQVSVDELPFHERHNIANAAMAASLALSFAPGSSARRQAEILDALSSFQGLTHRMEALGCRDGVLFINNSMCTNPSALVASSSSINARQHLLIGGVTKGLDFAPVDAYLKSTCHMAYLFGSDAEKINAQLGGLFPVFRTMEEAFFGAAGSARRGDIVMLAPGCASLDQFQDFRARGDEFRSLAKEWLNYEKTAAR